MAPLASWLPGRNGRRAAGSRVEPAPSAGIGSVRDAVVVITGASSGIGRATAYAFAQRGARLVLAARRDWVLREVARDCDKRGGRAIVVPTDVTDPRAVERLARAAEDAFGRIDVWVNNAGVGLFGPYDNARIELHRRVVETNLLGAMHGAAAVLPVFLQQGRGVLINTVSIGAWAPLPFAAAYTASKFGLRGLTASLRQELREEPGIQVCGVFPSVVDTPGLEHVANVSGRALDPGGLLFAPEQVAETIVALAQRPRGEVVVGWPARAAKLAYGLAPGGTERVLGAVVRRYVRHAPLSPRTTGALLQPVVRGTRPSGGWRERKAAASGRNVGKVGLALAGAALVFGVTAAVAHARRH